MTLFRSGVSSRLSSREFLYGENRQHFQNFWSESLCIHLEIETRRSGGWELEDKALRWRRTKYSDEDRLSAEPPAYRRYIHYKYGYDVTDRIR
jgi:hypothetical protein